MTSRCPSPATLASSGSASPWPAAGASSCATRNCPRAARLCPQPDDADDAVQDAFLQALIALDRLRDPDRFAGWLGGIVANVCRTQRRRAPLTLLGDWPEHLHPASAGGQPSAEDLDRADVLSRAVAGLP